MVDGKADHNNPIRIGRHSQGCCSKMGISTETDYWEGTEDFASEVVEVEVVDVEKELDIV